MDSELAVNVEDLRETRERAKAALTHIQRVVDLYVTQAVVKEALSRGATQRQAAAGLGLSNRDVTRWANTMWRPLSIDDAHTELHQAFLAALWGCPEEVREALRGCYEYDAEQWGEVAVGDSLRAGEEPDEVPPHLRLSE